jgi:hypothetical protein
MTDHINGLFGQQLQGLREDIAEEQQELRSFFSELNSTMKQMNAELGDLERTILHLSSVIIATKNHVPVDVFRDVFKWVFGVVFLLIAGIATLKFFLPAAFS